MPSPEFQLHFVAVGPTKTGTSWLHEMLKHHPEVGVPEVVKETFFFNRRWDKGRSWLANLYPASHPNVVCGECGPTYFPDRQAMLRIKSFGVRKVIISLRNPIERSLSHFWHGYAKQRYDSFSAALRVNPAIVEASYYSTLIPEWEKIFGVENVLLVDAGALREHGPTILNDVTRFLDVCLQDWPTAGAVVGGATIPRNRVLAKLGTVAARNLRDRDFHKLVELGKQLGIKRALFGGRPQDALDSVLSCEDRNILENKLAEELAQYQRFAERYLKALEIGSAAGVHYR